MGVRCLARKHSDQRYRAASLSTGILVRAYTQTHANTRGREQVASKFIHFVRRGTAERSDLVSTTTRTETKRTGVSYRELELHRTIHTDEPDLRMLENSAASTTRHSFVVVLLVCRNGQPTNKILTRWRRNQKDGRSR